MTKDVFVTKFADELVRLVENDDECKPVTRERALQMGACTFDASSDETPEDVALRFHMCGDR